jgi:hypothetical protein
MIWANLDYMYNTGYLVPDKISKIDSYLIFNSHVLKFAYNKGFDRNKNYKFYVVVTNDFIYQRIQGSLTKPFWDIRY